MIKLEKRLSPLCYLKDGRLLAYRFGEILFLNDKYEIINRFLLFKNFKERSLSRINILHRLLRLGIRTALQINDEIVILMVKNLIYEFNIFTYQITRGHEFGIGIRALNFSQITDINGFNDMVVFGGYLSNPDKKQVHVYKRCQVDKWEIVYTFKEGKINHIHNIIPDKENNCVWILTGDFVNSAAIWKATNNFKKVEYILGNDQKYRSCVGFPVKSGLLYATDSPFTDNSIRFLSEKNGAWVSEKIKDIAGSCIYGCQVKDQFVFSTAVEGDGRKSGILNLIFDTKKGRGIKDRYSHLYTGNLEKSFNEVYRSKKDNFPFILQFGVLKFPKGYNGTEYIVTEHVATKKFDLSAVAISLNK